MSTSCSLTTWILRRCWHLREPVVLVLEDHTADGTRRSRRVVELYETIIDYATARGLMLCRYPHTQVQDIFEMFGAKTKYAIARKIAEWLPQFEASIPRYRNPWMSEPYRSGEFDAIALILTHYYVTA